MLSAYISCFGGWLLPVVNKLLRLNPMVVCAEVENEAVLLDVDSGLYYGLDEIGAVIWKGLGEGSDRDRIVETIVAEYDVSIEQAAADVEEFVGLLMARGLTREEPA